MKRFSILQDDDTHCLLCKRYITKYTRNTHEVFHGTSNRKKSIKYGCCAYLCIDCHNKVHSDHQVDWELKQRFQRKFEELYGYIKFMEVFKRNYL